MQTTLMNDMKEAMKSGDKAKLTTIRFLMAEVKNALIDKPGHEPITEDEFHKILKKLVKNTEEALAQYRAAGREDLSSEEAANLAIFKSYLPEQLDDVALTELVQKIVAENPGLGIGPLTGKVLQAAGGKTEGSAVGAKLRALLG